MPRKFSNIKKKSQNALQAASREATSYAENVVLGGNTRASKLVDSSWLKPKQERQPLASLADNSEEQKVDEKKYRSPKEKRNDRYIIAGKAAITASNFIPVPVLSDAVETTKSLIEGYNNKSSLGKNTAKAATSIATTSTQIGLIAAFPLMAPFAPTVGRAVKQTLRSTRMEESIANGIDNTAERMKERREGTRYQKSGINGSFSR